ncbi:hypothetical protein DL96DRAFT_1707253 [Flagelloscypha sp. PMI_526]|nr:hypothetical protein DL96DRAFT_1707253 [Flagelloscypha sp. PMI_526]
MADSPTSSVGPSSLAHHKAVKVMLVFVHGFKGNDSTFAQFPQRLQNMLSESSPEYTFESIVFPAYETKGNLPEAVVKFSDWLTSLTVEKEAETGLGSGSVQIVLCGHSMGGLLVVDTLLEFEQSRINATDPLWPRIIGIIAYDTPYYGLHPHVFKNSANKAAEHLNAAKTVGSALLGSFAGFGAKKAADGENNSAGAITAPPGTPPPSATTSKWGTAAFALGGALIAGATAGGAYWKKDDLNIGYSWFTDHMKYVGNLWEEEAMKARMDNLRRVMESDKILFRNYYTFIPATPPAFFQPRTFVLLPKPEEAPLERYFVKSQNHLATDELAAHTGMFSGGTNGGFYELGLNSAKTIRAMLDIKSGEFSKASS